MYLYKVFQALSPPDFDVLPSELNHLNSSTWSVYHLLEIISDYV